MNPAELLNADHYVLDLETLGKRDKAAIASIGMVKISGGRICDSLYLRVDPSHALKHGQQELDYSTVIFWLKQSEAARTELTTTQDRVSLPTALQRVAKFMGYNEQIGANTTSFIWGNGDDFDCNILASAFEQLNHKLPWHYSKQQNLRTILELYPEAKALAGEFEGTRHHALHDAMHEAKRLLVALQLHASHQARNYVFATSEELPNAAVAALEYALRLGTECPMDFLRCWFQGDFDDIRKEWPDAPDEVFIGADSLFKPSN